jgi:hypothetical protein
MKRTTFDNVAEAVEQSTTLSGEEKNLILLSGVEHLDEGVGNWDFPADEDQLHDVQGCCFYSETIAGRAPFFKLIKELEA